MKTKVVLKTTRKNRHRVESCLGSWLHGLDYICMTDVLTGSGDELSCGLGEDYRSAEEKTCNFFIKVREGLYSDYDWLAFIDDDAVLDYGRLVPMLADIDRDKVHGLNMRGAWPEDKSLLYPSGGAGYFVSPELVRSLPPMDIIGIGIEDVRVGVWMRDNGIDLDSSLPLNGWFPLMEIFEELKSAEMQGGSVEEIFARLGEEQRNKIRSKITHHYVRGHDTMKCFYGVMTSGRIAAET